MKQGSRLEEMMSASSTYSNQCSEVFAPLVCHSGKQPVLWMHKNQWVRFDTKQ